MNELHLFAGAGGGILGGILLGHTCVCAVEIEPYCRKVLLQRQRDGILPKFPIWDDVRTFSGKPWRGLIDVVCGGFPCQDISAAGKGKGITGERSGLWGEMARIVSEVGPRYVFVENSPLLVSRGLAMVLRDLAQMGYDAKWGIISARDAGAPHERKRIWILAYTKSKLNRSIIKNGNSWEHQESKRESRGDSLCEDLADSSSTQPQRGGLSIRGESQYSNFGASTSKWWNNDPANVPERNLGRVVNGVAAEVDRLKAIGNGQVPAVVELAWEILSQ